jgi:peptidoglycan/LPS O-acetylase OafA/YrhL
MNVPSIGDRAATGRASDYVPACMTISGPVVAATSALGSSTLGSPSVRIRAVDGLRAVAIALVVAYHYWPGRVPTGYLGVSVFFTISGFVVTRSLVRRNLTTESTRALGGFFAGRVRRLLPAAIAVLVVVVAASRWGGPPVDSDEVRAAVSFVSNWYQIGTDESYADLVVGSPGTRSPLTHYWSLSLEEQIYVVWPFLLLFALRFRGPSARLVMSAWSFAAVATIVGAQFVDVDQRYFAVWFRMSEFLVGGALALVPYETVRRIRRPGRLGIAALTALVVIALDPLESFDGWLLGGWFPVLSVISAAVVLACVPNGPFARTLGRGPLVWIGERSYGIYLIHWPIFVWVGRPVVALGLSVVAAAALHAAVEKPIMSWRTRDSVTIVTGMSAVVVAAVVLPGSVVEPTRFDSAVAEAWLARADGIERDANDAITSQIEVEVSPALESGSTIAPVPTASPATLPSRPAPHTTAAAGLTVVVYGDSTAQAFAGGLAEAAFGLDADVRIRSFASGACGVVRGGHYRVPVFDAALGLDCVEMWAGLSETLQAAPAPDLLLVHVSLADTWERRWDDSGAWLEPGDPAYAARIRDDYRDLFSAALAAGVGQIAWIRPPPISVAGEIEPSYASGGGQALIEAVVEDLARSDDRIRVVDLRGWVIGVESEEGISLRPDGIHMDQDSARRAASEFVLPALLG